ACAAPTGGRASAGWSGTSTSQATRADRGRRPPSVVGAERAEQLGEALARLRAACREVLGGDFGGGRRGAGEDAAADRLAVHLVGPVIDACRAREAVHLLE